MTMPQFAILLLLNVYSAFDFFLLKIKLNKTLLYMVSVYLEHLGMELLGSSLRIFNFTKILSDAPTKST